MVPCSASHYPSSGTTAPFADWPDPINVRRSVSSLAGLRRILQPGSEKTTESRAGTERRRARGVSFASRNRAHAPGMGAQSGCRRTGSLTHFLRMIRLNAE